jgi:hypothetical protein
MINFDKKGLLGLAESIKTTGLLQPIPSSRPAIGSRSSRGKDDGETINWQEFHLIGMLS